MAFGVTRDQLSLKSKNSILNWPIQVQDGDFFKQFQKLQRVEVAGPTVG